MADKEEGPTKGEPGKGARKAKTARRRKKSDGLRRVHLVVAIAHPLRRRILRLIADWGESASPAQIATELDLPVGTIGYHVRVLKHFGAVELTDEKPVGGAVERFYDSKIEDDPPVEALLDETREADEEDKWSRP